MTYVVRVKGQKSVLKLYIHVSIVYIAETCFSALRAALENIRGELDMKASHLGNLEKQRNDFEWSLGEHRQWLQDANNRSSKFRIFFLLRSISAHC